MASPTVRSWPRRQALLFLLAILVPCSVLILLTLRMLAQDRELADKRIADERRRLTADIRQGLVARAERLRSGTMGGTEVALVAHVENGRLVLPWQREDLTAEASATLDAPQFSQRIRQGEALEFGSLDFESAAAAYESAFRAASSVTQRASAGLLAARAFGKGARRRDALRLAGGVLACPPEVVDDQGIPFALYAARAFVGWSEASSPTHAAVLVALDRVASSHVVVPEALYMARDVARRVQGGEAVSKAIERRLQDVEQSLRLADEWPTRGIAVSTAAQPVWATYGPSENLWVVNVSADDARGARVTALRAPPLFAVREDVTISASREGDVLAPNFPDLSATFAPEALAELAAEHRSRQPFYIGALTVVVSIAIVGAYLFWRDVQREIRMANMRSQFVSSVSHELKTPLTAIRMFAETLLMGGRVRPEVQHEYLETIVDESERLTRLLNNVLDFSKIESGTKVYRLQSQSLASVVNAAAKAMRYPLAQQGFDLRVDVDSAVPAVAADPDAIQQAILNLLSNAMKYSGDGRIVEMSLKQEGECAVIAVTDRGVGIAQDEQARIFEKFYRIRDAATERIAGTGLGLTLVEHIARAHGGRVTVQSAPGEGSTFKILLPVT